MVTTARVTSLGSGCVSVQLTGELDLVTAPALTEQFASALDMSPHLVVDLREVTFVDAAVIATFLAAQRQALVQGGSLTVVGANPWVEKVLRAARATEAIALLPHERSDHTSNGHHDDSLAPA